MSKNTTTDYFGKGVDTSRIFDFDETYSNGEPKCCLGERYNYNGKWYSLKDNSSFGVSGIVFCQYCGENSIPRDKTYELTDVYDKTFLKCSTIYTDKCIDNSISNRVTNYIGIRFNVNIINKEDNEFAPATKIIDVNNDRGNTLKVNIPSGAYYEVVIMGDKRYNWGNNMCFKIEQASLSDGRQIVYNSKNGGDVYCDLKTFSGISKQVRINSTINNSYGHRLQFFAPSVLDGDSGHENKSNIINFKIGIYNEQVYIPKQEPKQEPKQAIYRSSGITLEAEGHSKSPNTVDTQNTFIHSHSVNIQIHLLNSESEEEKLEKSLSIQGQVLSHQVIPNKRNDKIDKIQRRVGQIQTQMSIWKNIIKKMENTIEELVTEIDDLNKS